MIKYGEFIEFPEHILGLARAILDGELLEDIIHDAFAELGMVRFAAHFQGADTHCPGTKNCDVCNYILTGNFTRLTSEFRNDYKRYRNRLCPPLKKNS